LPLAAQVLAFTALAPIWTSLFSKLALGDVIRRRTVLANMGALAGTIIVVIGVAVTSSSGSVTVANDVVGIICAILTGLASALFYTTLRSAFKRAPGTPMLWGSTYGMALSTLIGFACIPLAPPGDPLLPNKAAITWLVLNGACCVALALLAITFASSMTPAAEVSLIMQLEGLLGPISTYAVLGEVPTPYTLGGGALVLLSVAAHEALSIRDQRRKPDDGPQDGPAADEPVAAKAATDE
jgi:drug/metabolite transporter (DMT)-like permease